PRHARNAAPERCAPSAFRDSHGGGLIAIALLSGCYHPAPVRRPPAPVEFRFGSGTGIRTLNLAVNSRLLYRLSYPGIRSKILGDAGSPSAQNRSPYRAGWIGTPTLRGRILQIRPRPPSLRRPR